MDVAYDHIQEEVLSPDEAAEKQKNDDNAHGSDLNTEFAEAYKAISSSPWGAKFGALVGTVKKQGETYYEGARQEYTAASSQATKGLNEIISRTRSLSVKQPASSEVGSTSQSTGPDQPAAEGDPNTRSAPRSQSEALHDSEGILSRFRSEAAKRLKDIEKAEEAADEALLKFGTNIRNFLREAVSVAPPSEGGTDKDGKSTVLFESKGHDGKRVIHTTRFDAQLHVIHSSRDSLKGDPASPEYAGWKEDFSIEAKTGDISNDLPKYPELRLAMAQLVPDQVSYEDFWARYYFLRHVIETEERKRRELLKGAATSEEEIAWDEDSDTETPTATKSSDPPKKPSSIESSTTLHPTTASTPPPSSNTTEDPSATPTARKPSLKEPRKSNDVHSQPDSDASYDLISGTSTTGPPSRAPGSPREEKDRDKGGKGEESEEEDWE
ncbi:MAG: hypothetical protein M1817_000460 [Caeruleum heppii]|nr:MAG: hypothetical protein M1817_000460 [Caeruleum heppii]